MPTGLRFVDALGFNTPRPDLTPAELARAVRDLAVMLDETLLRFEELTNPEVRIERQTYYIETSSEGSAADVQTFQATEAEAGISVGMAIHARANGTVLKAGRDEDRPATGFAVESLGGGVWRCAIMTLQEIALAGTVETTMQQVWLDDAGAMSADKPASGLIQPLGTVLSYNATTSKYLCQLFAGAVAVALEL